MSISTAAMTAVCLGTSTYAWFSKNEVVWTEETDFNLDFYSGLLISFDGANYHQDVTKAQLAQAMTGIEDEDEALEAFKQISLDGVTPKMENEKIQYDDTTKYVKFTYDTVDEEGHDDGNGNTVYDHTAVDAVANNKYLRFDLWFKLADGGVPKSASAPVYNLVFTDKTSVKSKAGKQEVTLLNKLNTMTEEKSAGETIDVDGANSLRVGVETYNDDNQDMIVFEPVNEYNLGSAAVEGRADDLHNPAKNAMYTYYNNFFREKFTQAADDGEAFETYSKFTDGVLGTFEASLDSTTNQYVYNDIKLTMYIWLEGWDADYFYGITNSNELSRAMQSYFEFSFVEV